MDPVTAAIVAAFAVITNEATKKATADAYEALKKIIWRKQPADSAATKLITAIEVLPNPAEAAKGLDSQIAQLKLSDDPEILEAANRVSDASGQASVRTGHISTGNISNSNVINQTGNGGHTATIHASRNINKPNRA